MKKIASMFLFFVISQFANSQGLMNEYDRYQGAVRNKQNAEKLAEAEESEAVMAAGRFGMVISCNYGSVKIFYKGRVFIADDINMRGISGTLGFQKMYYTINGDWIKWTTLKTIDEINLVTGDYYQKLKSSNYVDFSKASCKRIR